MGYIASGASVSLDGITFSMTAVQTGETATHVTYALSLSTSGSTPHATNQRIEGNASDPATATGGWFNVAWGSATGPSTWTTTASIPKSGGVRFYQYNMTESPSKNSVILFLYTGDPPPEPEEPEPEPEEPEPEPADPNWLLALGIVQALCGGRWTYPALRVVDRLPYPVNGRLRLDGQPLQTVHTVTTSGTAIPFERIGNASIRFAERREGGTFCNPPAEVEVEYTYGWDTLPPRLKAAVDRLAEELTAAETGGACQIPERVMSVSRQGMSWDLIDPMEFLDAGRTGIYEVDLALRTYNPGGSRRKARVFSVDRPPPERIVIAYAHP